MKASICIATRDKPKLLKNTLDSIFCQNVTFNYEVIVVDDRSLSEDTMRLCATYPRLRYVKINQLTPVENPAKARNVAYRMAKGEVLVCQSDDVIHYSENVIQRLVEDIRPNTFLITTVLNVSEDGMSTANKFQGYGGNLSVYTSPSKPRPLFFLGSIFKKDLYTVGGNDEDFVAPSGEDRWFGLCLIRGLKLKPEYSTEIIGHHQAHQHCSVNDIGPSQKLLKIKIAKAQRTNIWQSSGGPWSS
jgi:glycosyltransferase involved in cell wall biosynthesis